MNNFYVGKKRSNKVQNVVQFKSLKRHGKVQLSQKKFGIFIFLVKRLFETEKNAEILGFHKRNNVLIWKRTNETQEQRMPYE